MLKTYIRTQHIQAEKLPDGSYDVVQRWQRFRVPGFIFEAQCKEVDITDAELINDTPGRTETQN